MKIPKVKLGEPVMVVWEDAVSPFPGWGPGDQVGELERVLTVGFFHSVDKKRLTVFHSAGTQTGHLAGALNIPVSCVRVFKRLRVK